MVPPTRGWALLPGVRSTEGGPRESWAGIWVSDARQKTNLAFSFKWVAEPLLSPRIAASLANWQNLLHSQVSLERARLVVVSSSVSCVILLFFSANVCCPLCAHRQVPFASKVFTVWTKPQHRKSSRGICTGRWFCLTTRFKKN